MNRRTARRLSLCLLVGLVILGCASPLIVTPPPPAPVSEPIDTIVVRTAAVAQTQTAFLRPPTKTLTATAFPTRTVTITPTPTATVVFLFLTETSPPDSLLTDEVTEDESGTANGGDSDFVKPTATPSEWACRVSSKSPVNGTLITAGSDFRAVWTVENTGTKTWPKKGVDVVYHSGADLRQGKPYIDMPTTVGPGGKVTISVTLTVPKYPKVYSTRWSLRVGKRDFCYVRFVVEVQ